MGTADMIINDRPETSTTSAKILIPLLKASPGKDIKAEIRCAVAGLNYWNRLKLEFVSLEYEAWEYYYLLPPKRVLNTWASNQPS